MMYDDDVNQMESAPIFVKKLLIDAIMDDVDLQVDEEDKVIIGDLVQISGEDIEYLKRMYSSLDKTPKEISEKVREEVIGQDEAIEEIARVIYYNQLLNLIEEISGEEFDKINIVIIGDTGVGKTAIIRALTKQFNMPFIRFTADSITSAGYVGDNIEDILLRLYYAADEDLAVAERGVIYIDEFDKKVTQFDRNGRDINGKSVQQELLKLFEPNDINLVLPNKTKITFNTGKLTIIAGGFFEGLDDIRKKRLNKATVGFSTEENTSDDEINKKCYIPQDLIKYGFIPELVGRIVKIKELRKLDVEDLFKIIIKGKNSMYRQLTKVIVNYLNIEIQISFEFLHNIAQKASKTGTNARALKSKIWNIFSPIISVGLENRKKEGICIVEKNGEYIIEYDDISFCGILSDE